MDHCMQFTAIFDFYGDGVIHSDEFVDFARFLCVMEYLQGPESQQINTGLAILEDSKSIDELIECVKKDKTHMRKVIPYLPAEIRDELYSDEFVYTCLERFSELDADGSGSLEPVELYPLILDMTNAHHHALDL